MLFSHMLLYLFLHKQSYFNITQFSPIWSALKKNLASSFNAKLKKIIDPSFQSYHSSWMKFVLFLTFWIIYDLSCKSISTRNFPEISEKLDVLPFFFKGQELWLFKTSNSNYMKKNQDYLALFYIAIFGVRKISHLVCTALLYYCAGTNLFVYWFKLI